MKVYVHLLGYLAQYSPTRGEEFTMDLAGEAVVAELLEALKFPAALERMILVNGAQAQISTRLADGDEVFVFAPAAGG
jgi:molybdopterin converting factor small subunit